MTSAFSARMKARAKQHRKDKKWRELGLQPCQLCLGDGKCHEKPCVRCKGTGWSTPIFVSAEPCQTEER